MTARAGIARCRGRWATSPSAAAGGRRPAGHRAAWPLGTVLSPSWVGLPLLASRSRPAGASAAGTARWPTACSTRTSRRCATLSHAGAHLARGAGDAARPLAVARPRAARECAARRGPRCARRAAAARRSASAWSCSASRASSSSAIWTTSARSPTARPPGCCSSRSRCPRAIVAIAVARRACTACCGRGVRAALAPRAADATGPVREMLAESLGDRTREHRLLACRSRRPSSTSPAGASTCPKPSPAGRGPPSSATAGASRRSSTTPRSTPSPELVQAAAAGRRARDRQRAPEGRAAREGRGAARLAAAHRRGRRRRPARARARPPRRRPAAARRARPRAAPAQVPSSGRLAAPARRQHRRRTSPARWRSCASWPAASIPPSSPTAACFPRWRRSRSAAKVPVELDVDVGDRLPAPIEAAAYFIVAEALTNVAKYAVDAHGAP